MSKILEGNYVFYKQRHVAIFNIVKPLELRVRPCMYVLRVRARAYVLLADFVHF